MSYETGTRGRLLAGRLRIVGGDPMPGRPVAAVDREAPPSAAAVRVALFDPALDADGREAWALAWRALAERGLVVPLIDVLEDEDLGPLVVIAMGTSRPVRSGSSVAADQAERLGAALASAGLDLRDLRLDDLGLDDDERLILDTVRFPAPAPSTPAQGADLVSTLIGPAERSEPPVRPARPTGTARRARGRRRIVPLVSVALLLAAGAIVLLPERSSAPASIAPATPDQEIDEAVLRALEETVRPPRETARRPRPERLDRAAKAAPTVVLDRVSSTSVVVEAAPTPPRAPDPDALPPADVPGEQSAAIPAVGSAGDLLPIDGEALPVDAAEDPPSPDTDGEVGDALPLDADGATGLASEFER